MFERLREIIGICAPLLALSAIFFALRFPWSDLLARGAWVMEQRLEIRSTWENVKGSLLGIELERVIISGSAGRLCQFDRINAHTGWGYIHLELWDKGKRKGTITVSPSSLRLSLFEIPFPGDIWPHTKGGHLSSQVEYHFSEESGKGHFQTILPEGLVSQVKGALNVKGDMDLRGRVLELTGGFEGSQVRGRGRLKVEFPASGAFLENASLQGQLDGITGSIPFQLGITGGLVKPEIKFSGGT